MTLKPEVLAIHQWIRDDAPVSMKMTITPKLIDALVQRLDAVRSAGPVSSGEGSEKDKGLSQGCGSDHSGSRDEPTVGATATLASGYRVGDFIGRSPVLCGHGHIDPNNLCPRCELGEDAAPPPALADEVVRLNAALDWFGQNQGLSLEFDWSDADTDGLDWVVYRENGGINDREWTAIGNGPTPQAAILAAYKPFADRLPPTEGA